MNYMILFWALFALGILAFLVNFIGTPAIRKRMEKKAIREQEMKIAQIKKGDKVMLVSGIFGYIRRIHKRTFSVEIADGVIIRVDQQGIMGFFGEERKNNSKKDSKTDLKIESKKDSKTESKTIKNK